MIANAALSQDPFIAAVVGRENDTARAGDHQALAIFDVYPIQSRVGRTRLFFPIKTAVVGREHDAV